MSSYSMVATVSDLRPSPVLTPAAAMRRYMESLPRQVTVKEEVTSPKFWKAVRTEFLATMLLTILGCGSCMRWKVPTSDETGSTEDFELKVSLAFGATVVTLVQCMGPISGGHMNPAVSLSFLIARHISPLRAVLYAIAQCLGALTGSAVLYGLTPVESRTGAGLGATEPLEELHLSQAFGMEFLGTLIVVLAALTNSEQADIGLKALGVGIAYTAAHLFTFRYTGASLNPARSLGPAVLTNTWKNHWVYWIGPLLGGIIGGFTYEYTRQDTSARQRSLRRKLPRDPSGVISGNETELTTSASNDLYNHV